MSWDLLAYRESADQNGTITQHSLGEWDEVKALVSAQLDVEWQGPFWCAMGGDGYSIEINVGSFDSKPGDPIRNIGFEVRGGGDPLPLIAEFCKRNDLTLHDLTSGADIDLDNPSAAGFETFQAHRDAAIERATEHHGQLSGEPGAADLVAAKERASQSGYLRDQPFEHMEYTQEEFCNNFVAWNEKLIFTGYVKDELAQEWRADRDAKGFYYIPDKTVKAPGPPLWYENITRIEVDQDRSSILVRGRDTGRVRRSYRIRFADNERKTAFVNTLIDNIGRKHRKEEGVAPGLLRLMSVPLVIAALITAIGYWLFSASTANKIAIAMAALFAFGFLRTLFGKPVKADHYIFKPQDSNAS